VPFFEPLFRALNQAQARYVVVGGVATVLHGYARFTADVDLMIDLDPDEARKVLNVLTESGLQPRAPVAVDDFADPRIRDEWRQTKNMQVFSLVDPDNPMRVVDLFIDNPIAFADLLAASTRVELETTSVRIAAIDDLIRLKRMAGRPHDLVDIENLEAIRDGRGTTHEP
jgi:Nucleotidyltransferase of unknown function (DUF6036)